MKPRHAAALARLSTKGNIGSLRNTGPNLIRATNWGMRIFVNLPDGNNAAFDIVQRAFDILQNSGIYSARLGGLINNQGVVLVDFSDKPRALLVLTRAGLQAVADLP